MPLVFLMTNHFVATFGPLLQFGFFLNQLFQVNTLTQQEKILS